MAMVTPGDVAPQRSPGLVSKIWSRVVRADPQVGPQPDLQETTVTGTSAETSANRGYDQYFRASYDRLVIYDDADEMDRQSEEISEALDTIADNATASDDGQMRSFKVVAQKQQVQDVLDEMVKTTHLHSLAYPMVRAAYKYGDLFVEVIANANLEISKLRMMRPKEIWRNQDDHSDLMRGEPKFDESGACLNKGGECAFEQRDVQTGNLLATFYPYQMLHGRWNWDGMSVYGNSGLRVTRVGWKKLHAEEESLILGRLIRSMMKLAFYVDTTGKSKPEKDQILRDFQDSVMKKTTADTRRDTPWSVLSDFFFSTDHYKMGGQVVESKTRVEAIDPKNDGLTHIDDVEYFHRKMTSTTRVPRSYLGFDKDSPAAGTVSMQDIQYVRVLRRVQAFVGHLIHQVADMALILQDFDTHDPANAYTIEWPPLSTVNEAAAADAAYKLAQAGALWLGTSSLNQTPVFTPKWIMKNMLTMNDDEIEDALKDLEEHKAQKATEDQAALDMKNNGLIKVAEATAKAKPAPQAGPTGNANPQVNDHSQRADPAKAKQGSNTAKKSVAQDIFTAHLMQEVTDLVNPGVDRLSNAQRAASAELQDLAHLFGKNGSG